MGLTLKQLLRSKRQISALSPVTNWEGGNIFVCFVSQTCYAVNRTGGGGGGEAPRAYTEPRAPTNTGKNGSDSEAAIAFKTTNLRVRSRDHVLPLFAV